MPESPQSANSTFRQSSERPVVSGLGLSSSSGGSEALEPAVRPLGAAAPAATAVWEEPRLSKKELWRRRLEAEALRARGLHARERRQVLPEMEGLCYKCFE
ncbi:hypothetical protein D1007_08000 [Hordeum vulgare]|nr:hypothetical protein D1007_08000 [Hordeum vulgare]